MPLRIFVSYSTKDLPVAAAVSKHLRSDGHEVYFAEETARVGTVLPTELEQRIKECDVFVVLWSANAKGSEWVSQEIGIAQGAGREVLPVLLERGLKLPGFINNRKYLPAYGSFRDALEHLGRAAVLHAEEKRKKQNLAFLGLGAVILLAVYSK